MAFADGPEFTRDEVRLALRNPGMPLEALRHPVTPIGMHYVLVHFDVPVLDAAAHELVVDGSVRTPVRLSMDDLRARPAVTTPVVMECAGSGRAHLTPRPISAPWHDEAVGCAEWTGTPLRGVLEAAGLLDEAVEVVFTGADRGFDRDVEQDYQRSLPVADALGDDLLLAYAMNGEPLPPPHGFPLRLVVPGWYGMASVKWLRAITAVADPFEGVQQTVLYTYKRTAEDPGEPVTRKRPRALLAPPGIPEFLSRLRRIAPGPTRIDGRAWSGGGAIRRVEFSADDGRTWVDADLDTPAGPHDWVGWTVEWDATPGEHVLSARATDERGETQPLRAEDAWNRGGYGVNAVQRVRAVVG
jgi:DMSO/TMAO reductase YedYZ molybdopterin-dependent catalytic subunit